jgi:hypothetical protein
MGMELGQYGDTLRHTAHVATDFAFIVWTKTAETLLLLLILGFCILLRVWVQGEGFFRLRNVPIVSFHYYYWLYGTHDYDENKKHRPTNTVYAVA